MVKFVFALRIPFLFLYVNIPALVYDLEIIATMASRTVFVNGYKCPSNKIDIKDLSFVKNFTKVIICGNLMPSIKCGMMAR